MEENTSKVLNLLKKHNTKATFFILGWIAARNPALVKLIYEQGHEIASHGYCHQLTHDMSKENLYDDLEKSKTILEDITKDKVTGYRAPKFSINNNLINALIETEYAYDSSLNEISRYCDYCNLEETSKRLNNDLLLFNNQLVEICLPTVNFMNKEIPISGGGFFRLYPFWLTRMLLKEHFKHKRYYMFYSHPWEIDNEQPKIKGLRFTNRFRHYSNIRGNYKKLELLITFLKKTGVKIMTAGEYVDMNKKERAAGLM